MTREVEIVERKISIESYNIHYVTAKIKNSSPKHTLLLMPSTLGSSFLDFTPQLQHLPKLLQNYQLISWDPPGYGKSIPPQRKFPMDLFQIDARLAHTLMELLNITTYSILGLSGGGITALFMAIMFPQNIQRVIAVSSHSHITEKEMKTYEYTRDVSKWIADLREPLYDFYGADYVNNSWSTFVDTLWRIYRERNGNYFKDRMSDIHAEVLLVLGERDGMIAREHEQDFAENIRQCRVIVVKDGKHKMNLQFVDEFNGIVADFLRMGCKL